MAIVCLPALGSGGASFLSSLGAVAGEVSWLVTVVTVASGWGGGGSGVILEAAWSLTSVSLGSAEVHWDLRVVIGPRGVGGVVLILGAIPLVRLAGAVSLVVLGASISSESLPVSRSRGGASFQVSEGSERPSRAYALGRPLFYGGVIVDEGWP